MMQQLKKAAPKLRLTLGCSTFVPKAHTPFQWYGVSGGEPGWAVLAGLGRAREKSGGHPRLGGKQVAQIPTAHC